MFLSHIHDSIQLSNVSILTPKLHFLVVRYGALCLCFHGIADYLRGFVCVYEYSVIDGALVASSMSVWCTFNIQLYTVY